MWDNVSVLKSNDANVLKYVFTKADAAVEAVLYKYPTYEDRTVICCSTQSGCPVGCRFCGAGDNFVRSLTADEIISQVEYLFKDQNIDTSKVKKCQIMFMSMGEPMLNFKHLTVAIKQLRKLYPTFALLISTSAPKVDYEPVYALSEEIPTVGLQFSVHESTDEARNALVPFKAKLSLAEIAVVGDEWHARTGRKPYFNYCAHEANTKDDDISRLLALFHPGIWNATISVICERDESIAHANDRQRELASDFMGKLLIEGYDVRCFDPAGQDDIGGGCGQLPHFQKWLKDNPDKARKSIGHGIPIVHMPT